MIYLVGLVQGIKLIEEYSEKILLEPRPVNIELYRETEKQKPEQKKAKTNKDD